MSLPKPSADTNVVITGASSGIGTEIARGLARRGYPLLLVARREERLVELAGELRDEHAVRVDLLPLDLADDAARGQLVDRVSRDSVAGCATAPDSAPAASSTRCRSNGNVKRWSSMRLH